MAVKNGRFARITLDGVTVAEMGQYTLSGFNRDTLEHTSFGDNVKKFVSGHVDAGEITFSGYYDATDPAQRALETACIQGRILQPGDLKIYVDTNYYFTSDSGGTMFVTKAKSVGMDKYGIATTQFTVKCAGTALVLLPPKSLSVSLSPSASPSKSPSKSASVSPSASPSKSPSMSPSASPSS
jgi:hypothetical protein